MTNWRIHNKQTDFQAQLISSITAAFIHCNSLLVVAYTSQSKLK